MLKFTVRATRLALLVAVLGSANAGVVPVPDDLNRMIMSASYAPNQRGDVRSAVRQAAERTSSVDAGAEQSGLPNDANPYAMLAAGLAIMAVMARRRWRNQL